MSILAATDPPIPVVIFSPLASRMPKDNPAGQRTFVKPSSVQQLWRQVRNLIAASRTSLMKHKLHSIVLVG
jgi:hypothetical protein